MNKKLTIRDVAKHAGVSHATVSYVLNDVKKVSEETKLKVLASIKELDYHPDFTAISLSKRKSNIIGLMVPLIKDSPASMFTKNQYYYELLSGVETVARENNFDTMITGVGEPEECRDWVIKRNLDGLIILGIFPEQLYTEMKKLDIPIVLIDTYEEHTNEYNNVKIDDELGGYLATKHLVELGHRNIGFVGTNLKTSPVDIRRFEGFKKVHREYNILFDEKLLFESFDITFDHAVSLGEHILSIHQDITAIVTVSDILGIGIINAFQKNKKHIPNDCSIVGFDDLSICKYINPGLTTIKQDILSKGMVAAELIVKSLQLGSSSFANKTVEIPINLVVRGSTKAI
ncbi:LacI family DNA-binding transcriptional regulator [Alkalicoccobacillus porphyridii]|uniref:LacI family transcriptional regulator n=1 Tax=Alkalicoccobacillus porphyridii TaxID=2597270 RepID=A0A553ZWV2_9BACI|nr:LacI family DNA-binding transcriptional regulator [Alkalicoccobacillus porphyridii]TSB45921.1 LacI family transcriptional regulator [Alkalicoccobacillus porphyridii]